LSNSFLTSKKTVIFSFLVVISALVVFAAISRNNVQEKKTDKDNSIKWYNFDDGLKTASENNKIVLIDFYTDWCHWCEVMDEKTYTSEEVRQLIEEKFIAVKFNAESKDEVTYKGKSIPQYKLAQELGVTGYPTTFFLESDGAVIGGQPGYLEPENFIKLLNYVANKEYLKTKK
jgi:thioredoxin-related protein